MPFKKGAPSANPSGRPKINGSIRARARVDSHAAYDELRRLAFNAEKESDRRGAVVDILRLAGVSFQSESEEARTLADLGAAKVLPGPKLEEIIGGPTLPLN